MINPPELLGKAYYEDSSYFSVSSYKQFLKCEYAGTQPFGDPTSSMMVGSYVDAFIEGTLEEFKAEHPEIISSRGSSKGELKSEFKLAEQICTYIENDPVFMQFMSGEKQTAMTGEITGVPWKIKMDSYVPNKAISDLKIMANITNQDGEYIDFITRWGYDIQMAVYQEIVYQNTGEKLPCFICAVEKKDPLNSVIVHLPQNHLDAVLYTVKQQAQKFWSIKTGESEPEYCGHCRHCLPLRKGTPLISLEDLV